MSLRVWLPLIDDIHNQGASGVTITNTSSTFVTGGKIGNAIQFGTAKSYLKLDDVTSFHSMTECSISLWLKVLTWNTGYATFFQFGLGTTPWTSYILGLLRNNTASTLCFTIANGSNSTQAGCLTPALDLNTWYHLTFTYKDNHCKIYTNGIETKDYTTQYAPNFAGITNGIIGACNNGNNYQTNCLMNDFRIYDHCLSAAEVKEIAQGLVLHYKLDNVPQGTITNAYNMSSWDTSATRGGFNAWGPSGHAGTSGNNTDRQYIYRSDRTYSYYISEDAGTGKYFIFYQSPAFEGGYRSLSAIIKEQNGIPINETVCVPSWNANVTGPNHAPLNIWTRKISLGNGFYLCQVDGFYQNGSNDLVSINVLPGYKIYISEIWLEDNKQVCSDVLFPIEYVEDSSGYNHNGIINSNPIISLETRRYNYSISFDGVDDCIKIPFNDIIKDKNYTVSVWTYKTSIGTKNYQTILGGPSGFELEARSSSSTSPLYRIHNWGGGTTAYEFNKWNLFTFVHTDSDSKLYVNSELKITGTSANIPTGNYYIGAWNSVTGQNYEGLMSDFRIYCTALDADAVRQLYEVGAKIDNKANFHTFEFNEFNTNKLTKTGIMNDNMEESIMTLPDGSCWQLLLFHYVDGGKNLFTSSNATNCNEFGLFSRLKDINNFTYNGKYEFYVIQDDVEYRWTQTNQPTASTISGLTTVSGYTNPVNGLAKANQSNTYIGYNAWWGACGCWTSYSTGGKTGIPGFGSHNANGICTRYMALYARIEKADVKISNQTLNASEIIEL